MLTLFESLKYINNHLLTVSVYDYVSLKKVLVVNIYTFDRIINECGILERVLVVIPINLLVIISLFLKMNGTLEN